MFIIILQKPECISLILVQYSVRTLNNGAIHYMLL